MQILGLLGMYFDAVVVKVKTFFTDEKCTFDFFPPLHSMAGANLNKSEWLVSNTTAASKYIPKRPRKCIN